jgi:hypothetical protein
MGYARSRKKSIGTNSGELFLLRGECRQLRLYVGWLVRVMKEACKNKGRDLSGFEEKEGYLAEVEVDEVFSFVSDVTSEVTAHDAMPSWIVFLVELLLDVRRDVLLNVIFLQSVGSDIHGILLHLLRHISILNNRLSVSHF